MFKNIGSQKWVVFAFDATDNTPKTGDANQITGSVWIDGVENAIDDTNPTELAHGYYAFDIAQAETNGDYLLMDAVSSTSDIIVVGVPGAVFTTAPASNTLTVAAIQAEMEENGASLLDTIADAIASGTYGLSALKTLIDAIPTVMEIQAEMEENGASLLDTIADAIANGTYGLSALKTLLDAISGYVDLIDDVTNGLIAIKAEVEGIGGVAMRGTDSAALASAWTAALATALGNYTAARAGYLDELAAANLPTDIDTLKTYCDILDDATNGLANIKLLIDALTAFVEGLHDLSAAQVNAEVVDALGTDIISELAQGIPAATPTIKTALMLLYMALRNQLTVTSSELGIYDDAATKIAKKALSDDGTTYTEGEMASGA